MEITRDDEFKFFKTRDGQKVRVIDVSNFGEVHGYVFTAPIGDFFEYELWSTNGRCHPTIDDELDLVERLED